MRTRIGIRIRSIIIAVVGTAAALTGAVEAQPFPSKPIEFNVHTSPGGGTDLFARAVTDLLAREKIFAQPIMSRTAPGAAAFWRSTMSRAKVGIRTWFSPSASGSFLAATNRKEFDLGLGTIHAACGVCTRSAGDRSGGRLEVQDRQGPDRSRA